MKECTKCWGSKELNEYHKRSRAKDGHESRCKQCISIDKKPIYQSNKEVIINRSKAYNKTNKESIKIRRHLKKPKIDDIRRKSNSEKIRLFHEQYNAKN